MNVNDELNQLTNNVQHACELIDRVESSIARRALAGQPLGKLRTEHAKAMRRLEGLGVVVHRACSSFPAIMLSDDNDLPPAWMERPATEDELRIYAPLLIRSIRELVNKADTEPAHR